MPFQLTAMRADNGYLLLPCKGPPRFLIASSGVRPIKVALFHLHGNSRHCRQQASLGTNEKTKLSARHSYSGGQNTVQTRGAINLLCLIFKFPSGGVVDNNTCSAHLYTVLYMTSAHVFLLRSSANKKPSQTFSYRYKLIDRGRSFCAGELFLSSVIEEIQNSKRCEKRGAGSGALP